MTDDTALPGPIDPATGQPDHTAEVATLGSWFRQNAVSLVLTAVAVGLVCVYLNPVGVAKVLVGLGLVIFLHELGHFLAAKWCDVHVKTFSIGFGPAVPFCSYRWGETTYMVGVVPLGGYVSMVGEGEGANDDDGEEDPRSFKNKSVGQRMLIISAGVVLNVVLGMAFFMAAYLHGVREKPATVAQVESGSAAWRAGIRTDTDIVRINGRLNPVFADIQPVVMSTVKGESVSLDLDHAGKRETLVVEPARDEGVYFPQLGVAPPSRLVLDSLRKRGVRPVQPGSPASEATPPFEPGDTVVGMTDPADRDEVTPLPADPRDTGKAQPDFNAYARRLVLLAGKPITFEVERAGGGKRERITVAPSFHVDLGARMRMEKVAAVRKGSPAEKAGVQAISAGDPAVAGDKIVAVGLPQAGGGREWLANGKRPVEAGPADPVRPLDPVKLPFEIDRWAFASPPPPSKVVTVVVLREVDHTEKRVALDLPFDDSFRFDNERVVNTNSPLPVPGLGLAYRVEASVDAVEPPAPGAPPAEGGLKPDDVIEAVQFQAVDPAGEVKKGPWNEIKSNQWASVDSALQGQSSPAVNLKVKRGDQVVELTVTARPDKTWPTTGNRGFYFQDDFRIVKAADAADALGLGVRRTVRFIRDTYLTLYAMARGRISPKTMSGPLTIASVSYRFAEEDFWQFLLFLGMISVNLAVVNFLPIPVLDGGHMVFLILEKVLGRPVPERMFAVAMYTGLFLILSLMVFVIFLDVKRLFFGWF